MSLLSTIVIGFLIGAVAKLFVPGRNPHGCIITTLLGIGGAWIGQRLFWMLGFGRVGFIGSVIGAILLLALYQVLRKNRD